MFFMESNLDTVGHGEIGRPITQEGCQGCYVSQVLGNPASKLRHKVTGFTK